MGTLLSPSNASHLPLVQAKLGASVARLELSSRPSINKWPHWAALAPDKSVLAIFLAVRCPPVVFVKARRPKSLLCLSQTLEIFFPRYSLRNQSPPSPDDFSKRFPPEASSPNSTVHQPSWDGIRRDEIESINRSINQSVGQSKCDTS